MNNKKTMPDPVAYAIFAENGNIRIWSKEPRDLPDLDSLGPMHHLITTEQAEAYADACVREALEEAAQTCEARIGTGDAGIDTSDCDEEAQECAVAIRDLIPTTK